MKSNKKHSIGALHDISFSRSGETITDVAELLQEITEQFQNVEPIQPKAEKEYTYYKSLNINFDNAKGTINVTLSGVKLSDLANVSRMAIASISI